PMRVVTVSLKAETQHGRSRRKSLVMSALGQKRTFSAFLSHVHFASNSEHQKWLARFGISSSGSLAILLAIRRAAFKKGEGRVRVDHGQRRIASESFRASPRCPLLP